MPLKSRDNEYGNLPTTAKNSFFDILKTEIKLLRKSLNHFDTNALRSESV